MYSLTQNIFYHCPNSHMQIQSNKIWGEIIEPITDEEIVDLICTENDAKQEESDDEEDDISHTNTIKSTTEFLAIIDQQKVFMRRNKLPVKTVEQLEALVVGKQLSFFSMQKEVTNYFPSSQSPKLKDRFRSTANVLVDLTLVDSLNDGKQEEKGVPMISKKKLKLTGPVVLEKVMALNNSVVSSLDTETESDSASLFSSQE